MIILSRSYLSADELDYDSIAANLASGRGFSLNSTTLSIDRTPGYPFFLAVIYLIFGHNIFIAKIAQLIINALTCVILYLLTKRIFGEKIAIYTAIFVAVYPPLATMALSLYSEALFTFLFALSILLLQIAIEKERLTIFCLSGLSLALATHTRPTPILFPLMVLAAVPFLNKKRKLLLKGISIYLIVFGVVLSLWILRNYIIFREFVVFHNKGGIVLWTGNYIPGKGDFDNVITRKALIATIAKVRGINFKESDLINQSFVNDMYASVTPEIDRYLAREALKNIINNPGGFFALIPVKIIRLWTGSYAWIYNINISFGDFIRDGSLFKKYLFKFILKSATLVLSILIFLSGCLGMYIERARWRDSILILLPVLYFTLFHSIVNAFSRLGLPVVPFLLVYSVCGAAYIFRKIRYRSCRLEPRAKAWVGSI